jgi:hypothetical protein
MNRKIPAIDTIAVPTPTGRHNAAGTRTPQNDIAAIPKPTSDTIQRALASAVAVSALNDGASHDRAARYWTPAIDQSRPFTCLKNSSKRASASSTPGNLSFSSPQCATR